MEPPVPAVGDLEGHFLVLVIVLAYVDMKTVFRHIMQWPAGHFLFLCTALPADESTVHQFLPDLDQILFFACDIQRDLDALQMLQLCTGLLHQAGQCFKRTLLLAVPVKIFLCILRRRQRLIQRDLYGRIVIIIECLIFFYICRHLITVGIEQLPIQPHLLPLFGILQLLFLQFQFFRITFRCRLHDPAQIRGSLPYAYDSFLLRIVILQQQRYALVILLLCIHPGIDRSKLLRRTIFVIDHRRKLTDLYMPHHIGKRPPQLSRFLRIRQYALYIFFSVHLRPPYDLACHLWRDSHVTGHQRTIRRQVLSLQSIQKILRACKQRIFFFRRLRNKIRPPRQHLTYGTDHSGYMLDAVYDGILFIDQDDIAVLSHDLDNQGLFAQIPHFIQVLHIHTQDTFQPRLGKAEDPGVLQVLTTDHTEIRCRHRTRFVNVRQIDQRQGRIGRQ